MASENEVITMESSCHHMTKCTSLNKLPHSKRWIQQITIISNYWIQLSYDLKNYADFGGDYRLRWITPSEICIILKVIRKPNPVLVLLFIWKSNYKRSRESARLPPMWPGFKSWRRRHVWVEFVVGSLLCSEQFFSWNISKFQFDHESGRRRTTLWMSYPQNIIILKRS